jgi:hypothetical protein
MGNNSSPALSAAPPHLLLIRVQFHEFREINGNLTNTRLPYILFIFTISYQRYSWRLSKRFSEIKSIRRYLSQSLFSEFVQQIPFPKNLFRIQSQPNKLLERGQLIAHFLEAVGSQEEILRDAQFRRFLEIGTVSQLFFFCHSFIY